MVPDDYNSSIMVSEEDTKIKNEILRKIKYEKMKKAKLRNFIRIERERILQQREIEQRQLLMNASHVSLHSNNGADTQLRNGEPVSLTLNNQTSTAKKAAIINSG